MKNISFSGHRVVKDVELNKQKLCNVIEDEILNGATDFYAGGAIGWDMLCEDMVLDFKKEYSDIKLHLILPCSMKEQTARWTRDDVAHYKRICQRSDSIEFTSKYYYTGCMKDRNEALIARSDGLICYYFEEKYASGTGQTVRMAQKKHIKIINIAICR